MADLSQPSTGKLEARLEELARHIPGFSGYLDRERRRDADKLQREFLAKRLTELKSRMQRQAEGLLAAGNLSMVGRFDQVGNKMDRVIERMRHAAYGYNAFFEAPEVNQEELDTIYEHDLSMVGNLDQIEKALAAAGPSAPDLGAAALELENRVLELDAKIDERERILKGVH